MSTTWPAAAARGRRPPHERPATPVPLYLRLGASDRGSATCSASWAGRVSALMADRWIVMASTGSGCRARCWFPARPRDPADRSIDPPTLQFAPRRGRAKWTGWTTSRPGARRSPPVTAAGAWPSITGPPTGCQRNPSRRSTSAGRRRPASVSAHRPALGRAAFGRRGRKCHWPLPRSGPRRRCWRCSGRQAAAAAQEDPEARSNQAQPVRQYTADRTRVRDKRKRRPGSRFSATGQGVRATRRSRRAHAGTDAHHHHAVLCFLRRMPWTIVAVRIAGRAHGWPSAIAPRAG